MTARATPTPALDPGLLYVGDNGRLFCGKLRCAGTTAYITGHDLSGQALDVFDDAYAAEWRADIGAEACCEGCKQPYVSRGEWHVSILQTVTFPSAIKSAADAERFVRGMVALVGGGFHPDTPPADYIDLPTRQPTFAPEAAARLDTLLCQVGDVPGVDIYALGLRIVKELVP